jgi:hypothetical protein
MRIDIIEEGGHSLFLMRKTSERPAKEQEK